jgi:hypothetical protein
VLLKNDIDIVKCCGLISYWECYPINTGTLKFVVWRSINVDNYYEVVGTNSVNITGTFRDNFTVGETFIFGC